MADAIEADQLQADPPAGRQPRGAPLEEGAVDGHLVVGVELVGGEVLGRLDAGDRVVAGAGSWSAQCSRRYSTPSTRRACEGST